MISRSGAPLTGSFTTTTTWAAACPRSLGSLPRWSACEPPHVGTPASKPSQSRGWEGTEGGGRRQRAAARRGSPRVALAAHDSAICTALTATPNCALRCTARRVPPTNAARRKGVDTCLQRGVGRAALGGDGGRPSRRGGGVGWWRRAGAGHTAYLPPAADLMPPRAPLSTPPPAPAPLSQVVGQQQPDRNHPHAVRAAYQAD